MPDSFSGIGGWEIKDQDWRDSKTGINNSITALQQAVANFGSYAVVASTASITEPNTKTIYLVKDTTVIGSDAYQEYICTDPSTSAYELIGDTTVDLSQYYMKTETSSVSELSTEFGNKLDSSIAASTYLTQTSSDSLYYPLSNNPSGYLTNTDISATSWNSVYDTVNSNSGSWTSAPVSQLTAGTDLVISNNIINLNTNGTANSSNKAFVANVATSATGNGAAAFGYNTSAGGDYSFAAGYYTRTNGSAMTVIGRYNRTSANTATLFVVGNGTSDSDRSDAFLVRTDGCRTISRGVDADSAKYYRTIMAPTSVSVFSSNSADNVTSYCQMYNNEIILSASNDDSLDIDRHSITIVDNQESLHITCKDLYYRESNGTVHSITWKDLIDKVNAL